MNTLLASRMAHLPPSFPSIFFFFGVFFFLMLLMGCSFLVDCVVTHTHTPCFQHMQWW